MNAELKALRDRLRAASAGSEDLDEAVAKTIGDYESWREGTGGSTPVPATSSVDFALALCERKLPGWTYAVDASLPDAGIDVDLFAPGPATAHRTRLKGTGATLPLAILIALLEAMIGKETEAEF